MKIEADTTEALGSIESSLRRLEDGELSAEQRSTEIQNIRKQLGRALLFKPAEEAMKRSDCFANTESNILNQKAYAVIMAMTSCDDQTAHKILNRLSVRLGCPADKAAQAIVEQFDTVKKVTEQIAKKMGLKIERSAKERELINEAKKLVMDRMQLPEQVAYFLLQRYASHVNVDMTKVAESLLFDFNAAKTTLAKLESGIAAEYRKQLLSKPPRS